MGEMLERRKDPALWSDKAGLKCRPQGLWVGGVWGWWKPPWACRSVFCSLGLQGGPVRAQGDPLGLFPGIRSAQEICRVIPLTSSKEGLRASLDFATRLCDLGHVP